jgi:hypothetical protein
VRTIIWQLVCLYPEPHPGHPVPSPPAPMQCSHRQPGLVAPRVPLQPSGCSRNFGVHRILGAIFWGLPLSSSYSNPQGVVVGGSRGVRCGRDGGGGVDGWVEGGMWGGGSGGKGGGSGGGCVRLGYGWNVRSHRLESVAAFACPGNE